jgi:hypothetical protein
MYVAHDMVFFSDLLLKCFSICINFSVWHFMWTIWLHQIFLPINIQEMHWYLAVVNSKKREIQVLDSLGPMCRDDLKHVVSIMVFLHIIICTHNVFYSSIFFIIYKFIIIYNL